MKEKILLDTKHVGIVFDLRNWLFGVAYDSFTFADGDSGSLLSIGIGCIQIHIAIG